MKRTDDVAVRDALKQATAQLHTQAETCMPIARPSPSMADYRDHLLVMLDWLGRLKQIDADADAADGFVESLAQDLEICEGILRGTPRAPATWVAVLTGHVLGRQPPCKSALATLNASQWGVAYVLQGSRLGNQVMYRRLHESLAPHPLAYLRGAGGDTGRDWTRFLQQLSAAVRTPQDVALACAGAVTAFGLLLEILTPSEARF